MAKNVPFLQMLFEIDEQRKKQTEFGLLEYIENVRKAQSQINENATLEDAESAIREIGHKFGRGGLHEFLVDLIEKVNGC